MEKSAKRSAKVERLSAASFILKDSVPYEDVYGLHGLFEHCAFKTNLALIGSKGVGKSLSVAAFGQKKGWPVVTYDCSEDARRYHLLGMYVSRGGDTPFVLGPLTTAIEVANETGFCLLVLEEMNALSPAAQKLLNPLTDFRRKYEVPEAGAIFKLQPEAKLWVVGTMNDSVYGGVYQLNEDLKSRFRFLRLEYPDLAEEKRILAVSLGTDRFQALTKLAGGETLTQILRLAQESRQPSLSYALSPRDVVQLCEDTLDLGKNVALKVVVSKFEGRDLDTIKKRVTSIFCVDPDEVSWCVT